MKKKPTKPKTVAELKKKYPKTYEVFLIAKAVKGRTFKEFVNEIFG